MFPFRSSSSANALNVITHHPSPVGFYVLRRSVPRLRFNCRLDRPSIIGWMMACRPSRPSRPRRHSMRTLIGPFSWNWQRATSRRGVSNSLISQPIVPYPWYALQMRRTPCIFVTFARRHVASYLFIHFGYFIKHVITWTTRIHVKDRSGVFRPPTLSIINDKLSLLKIPIIYTPSSQMSYLWLCNLSSFVVAESVITGLIINRNSSEVVGFLYLFVSFLYRQ